MRLRLLFRPRNRQKLLLRNRQVLIVGSVFLAFIGALVVFIFHFSAPQTTLASNNNKDSFRSYQGLSFQKVIQTTDGNSLVSDGTNFVKLDTNGVSVWAKAITTPYNMVITSLAQTMDGDCVAVCQSSDTTSYKIGVIRVSNTGTLKWFKVFSASGSDFAYGVAPDNDNGVILTGGGCNISHYIMKIDAEGSVNWMKDFAIAGTTGSAYKVIVEADNSIMMVGRITSGKNNFISVIKTDQYGNYQWGKEIADLQLPIIKSFVKTSDGAFAFAGTYIGSGTDKPNNPFVVKVDASGNVIWFKRVGNDDGIESINDLAATPNGGVIAVGNVYVNEQENVNALLMRLDESGNIMWQKTAGNFDFNGAGYDDAYSICPTADGTFTIVGMAYWTFISKMDINGNGFCHTTALALTPETVNCSSSNIVYSQIPATLFGIENITTSTHNVYVSAPNSCTAASPATAVETVKPASDDVTFSLFPDPNDGNFNINYHLQLEGKGTLQIFDLTGKKLSDIELPTYTNSLSIHLPELMAGIYLYRIKDNNKIVKQEKFIVTRQ